MLRFDRVNLLLSKSILSESLANRIWGSDILLFSELVNIVFNLFYNFITFIILLYTFLVISFTAYKDCMIWWISFSKFPDVLLVQELLLVSEGFV